MLSQAFIALGLKANADLTDVKVAYRMLARHLHPDLGGNPSEFAELHQHYLDAIAEIILRPCPDCQGTKKVRQTNGFHVVLLPCMRCV